MARLIDTLEDHVAELAAGWQKDADPVQQILNILSRLINERRFEELVDVETMNGRDVLAQVVAMIATPKKSPILTAMAVDLVFQLGVFGGISETEMARQAGCTRANVNHYVMEIRDRFFRGKNLPWLRSEAARMTYSERAKAKPVAVEEWQFANALKKI